MGLDRRAFIKFVVGGAAGSLFTPMPWRLAGDSAMWSQNWSWVPKVPKGAVASAATISKLCPSGCAVKVRTVDGSAFGTEGNKGNVLSQGGICPVCASGVQMMRSPSRIKGPLKKEGKELKAVTWDEAEKLLVEKLAKLKGREGKVAAVCGDAFGSIGEVLSGLLAGLGSSACFMAPCDAQVASKAWRGLMNGSGQLGFDLENADFVLLLGADILDSFGPTVRNHKAFAATHPVAGDAAASYVYAGAVQTRTAAVCDKWVPVRPGAEIAFALGLANLLIKDGARSSAPDFGAFAELAARFGPEQVEKLAGVKADVLGQLAKALRGAKKPVVVPGASSGSPAAFAAGAALNLLLPAAVAALPDLPKAVSQAQDRGALFAKDLLGYLSAVAEGKTPAPEVLLVVEANPVYGLAQAETMAGALGKAGFSVAFATYLDETAAKADLVLPTPHSFERFDDLQSPFGVGQVTYCAAKPVQKPVLDVKPAGDFLLGLAKKLEINLGFDSFEDVLKAKAAAAGGSFDELASGNALVKPGGAASASLAAAALAKAAEPAKAQGLLVAPVAHLNIGTAGLATPPHNLITIRNTELLGLDLVVTVSGATAKELSLKEGAKVKLAGAKGECKAQVHVSETVMPGVVAAPLGLGRAAWDDFTKGKGDNAFKILAVNAETASGAYAWAGSAVNVAKI
jgi:anaerobic selenocysteine-containing dehydrogenase